MSGFLTPTELEHQTTDTTAYVSRRLYTICLVTVAMLDIMKFSQCSTVQNFNNVLFHMEVCSLI
jgi:hypothetical protein